MFHRNFLHNRNSSAKMDLGGCRGNNHITFLFIHLKALTLVLTGQFERRLVQVSSNFKFLNRAGKRDVIAKYSVTLPTWVYLR